MASSLRPDAVIIAPGSTSGFCHNGSRFGQRLVSGLSSTLLLLLLLVRFVFSGSAASLQEAVAATSQLRGEGRGRGRKGGGTPGPGSGGEAEAKARESEALLAEESRAREEREGEAVAARERANLAYHKAQEWQHWKQGMQQVSGTFLTFSYHGTMPFYFASPSHCLTVISVGMVPGCSLSIMLLLFRLLDPCSSILT